VKNQSGAATIEAVIWIPFFILLFCVVVDGTMVFSQRTQAIRIMQDANRSFAVGRLDTPEETETFILDRLRPLSPGASADTSVALGIISSRVAMPVSDLEITGLLSEITQDFTVVVQSQHMAEN
jgi:hypothetical protein